MNANLHRLRWLLFASACLLLGPASLASAQAAADPLPDCQIKELTNHGPQLKDPVTGAWTFSLDVHFICDGVEVFADEVTFDDKTLTANGNLLVIQEEVNAAGERVSVLRLNADRMEMDRATRLGTFYHAYGTARITEKGDKTIFGRQEPDIMFQADKIEKLGPKKYRLTHGAFTTCLQPNPRWQMIGGSGTVELGDHASMTNVRFMVKSLPVLYVPYMYYPLTKDDRSTGLLIPSYSSSGIKGNGISTAYFLVLGRSQDATLFYDYYTKAGQNAAVQYRFKSGPNAGGTAFFNTFYEKEQLASDGTTVERFAHTSYDFTGSTSQPLGHGFTLNGNSNYFTDITALQRYQQDVQAASSQRRFINVEVSGPVKLGPAASHAPTMTLKGLYGRNEIFSGTQSSLQGYAPRVTIWLSDNVRKSEAACRGVHTNLLCKVIYTVTGESAYLQSRPFGPSDAPGPETTVRRFDSLSSIRAPLSGNLSFLRVTGSASWRLTEYLDTRDPLTGVVAASPLARNIFDVGAQISGPTLERVFLTPGGRFGDAFQHMIEPTVTLDWLSNFDQAGRIFVIDQIDQVPSGTTRVAYSLMNRVMVKPHGPEGATQGHDFLTVAIGQSYYSNAQAATVDPANPIAGAGTLSPVQVQVVFTPNARVSGTFNVFKNMLQWPKPGLPQSSAQFSGWATIHLNQNQLLLTAGWSKTNYYTAAQGFVDLAPVHALDAATTVNAHQGQIGATYSFHFDVVNQKFLQQRVIVYYHSQCCGLALDYQAYSTVSSSIPVDHRVAVTFTLAGIGSFSPPLGAFGR